MKRALALVALVVAWTVTATAQIPAQFTNLTVLPKDVTQEQLVGLMKNFSQNLGVRCEHCHVGQGNDLSQFDFASDTRPAKATARQMLRLVSSINNALDQAMGPGKDGARVTCFTCHRGSRTPRRPPESIEASAPLSAH